MISAPCSICGKVTKTPHSCLSCGAVVCADHYDFTSGFCPRCRQKLKRAQAAPQPSRRFQHLVSGMPLNSDSPAQRT